MKSRSNKSINTQDVIKENNTSKINDGKDIDGLTMNYSDGLVESERPIEIAENTYQTKVIGITPGEQFIAATYHNSRPINRAVIVREGMARLTEVIPSNFVISEGETIDLTLVFDKPMANTQQPPKLILSNNLSLMTPFKLNPDRMSGYFTISGVNIGRGISECYFGGVEKEIESLVTIKDTSGSVYQIIKTDLLISDITAIKNYLSDTHIIPKNNDIAIIKVIEKSTIFAVRTYLYINDQWINTSGREQTSNLIIDDDIILAGNYNEVGNIIKEHDGQILKVKGSNILDLIKRLLTKILQPEVLTYPKITNFNHNQKEYVEFGTSLENIAYGNTAKLIQGQYSFDQVTNVSIEKSEIFRISNIGRVLIGDSLIGNDAFGAQLTEEINYLQYEANITYSDDLTSLKDNIGNPATNNINIKSGNTNMKSKKIQGYRKLFYGGLTGEINNENIRRELSYENNTLVKNDIIMKIKPGTKSVIIAFPKNTHSILKITNVTVMNTDVTDTFKKSSLTVMGANNYKGIEYDVYSYTPANPFQNPTEFLVKLGGGVNE